MKSCPRVIKVKAEGEDKDYDDMKNSNPWNGMMKCHQSSHEVMDSMTDEERGDPYAMIRKLVESMALK